MAYIYYNPNNRNRSDRGDCVIRAISKITKQSWDKTYWELCGQGYLMGEFGDSNDVWDAYLRGYGFKRRVIPNTCPDCYTVRDFCEDHPYGEYILATGNHTVAVSFGDYYDSWDSGSEIPIYYYSK
jgi:hypothetical protein